MHQDKTRFPSNLIIFITIICLLPSLMAVLDISLSWNQVLSATSVTAAKEAMTHTLLETIAVCTAAFVSFLAFSHYRITKDVTTPIISMALFVCGCIDAFHIGIIGSLIGDVTDNSNLSPITWTLSRSFNAIITTFGIALLLYKNQDQHKHLTTGYVIGISIALSIIACAGIYWASNSDQLPTTIFNQAIFVRPYDLLPLLVYLFAGLVILPKWYLRYPSIFTFSLIISTGPNVLAQLHMVFGSTTLYDHHFISAHYLKIIGYLLPLIGLSLDYIQSQKLLFIEIEKQKIAQKRLADAEYRQRTIINNVVDGVILLDTNGNIINYNLAAETIFGFDGVTMLGQPIRILMPDRYNDKNGSDEQLMHLLAETATGQRIGLKGKRQDNSEFSMDVAIATITLDNDTFYSCSIRDVSERKRIDKMKNEFIATVSHELRTPLTSIKGSLDLVIGGAVGNIPSAAKELITIANNNCHRLHLLINDILDIEKMGADEMLFHYENTEILTLLTQAINDNAAYAAKFNITFELRTRLVGIRLYTDPDRLTQVLCNLLSNAAKFSNPGDYVDIHMTEQAGVLRLSITDYGCGIAEDFQSRVFEKFSQSDASTTRDQEGSGLGLAISKQIIDKIGGHIGFISKESMGSTFYVDLWPIIQNKREVSKITAKINPQILIVENNQELGAMMQRAMIEAGFHARITKDSQTAQTLLSKHPNEFDLLLLGIHLPHENGHYFLDSLQRSHFNPRLPILIVSGVDTNYRHELRGSVVRIAQWLKKPFDKTHLQQLIDNTIILHKNSKILHVEDEQSIRRIVAIMLGDQCEIICANSLVQAKMQLQHNTVDMVLLDIGLPDGNGLELLATLQALSPPPVVVIFSAQDVNRTHADQITNILTKSATNELIIAPVIKSILNHTVLDKSVNIDDKQD